MRVRLRLGAVRLSPQLRRNLHPVYLAGGPLRSYLAQAAGTLAMAAQQAAPRDLGRLAGSHRWLMEGRAAPRWSEVQVRAPYALSVHEGTRPHFPPVHAVAPWAERHGVAPWALAVHISRRGTRPHPWLAQTVERLLPRLLDVRTLAADVVRRWKAS